MYDSGSVPRRAIFSLRETSTEIMNELGRDLAASGDDDQEGVLLGELRELEVLNQHVISYVDHFS